MTSRDFVYWLQGFFEIHRAGKPKDYKMKHLDEDQIECIENHLAMVFYHEIDPSMGDKEHQGKLNSIHSGQSSSIKPSASTEEVESNTLSSPLTHSPLHTTANWKKYPTKEGYLVRC